MVSYSLDKNTKVQCQTHETGETVRGDWNANAKETERVRRRLYGVSADQWRLYMLKAYEEK
jgi:hypothetical protein